MKSADLKAFLLKLWSCCQWLAAKLLACCWRFAAKLLVDSWWLVRPPDYTCGPAYAEAMTWLNRFQPDESLSGFDDALAYAWKKFDQAHSASESLDKKADILMRNAGIVGGLLGITFNFVKPAGAVGLDSWTATLLIPSLVALLVSLIFAAHAHQPAGHASSATVSDLLDDIAAGKGSQAYLAASLHLAIVGRGCLNDWKARHLTISTYSFVVGLMLLLVPFIVSALPSLRSLLFHIANWFY